MKLQGKQGRQFSSQEMEAIREHFYYVEEGTTGEKRIFFDSASGSLRLKEMVQAVGKVLPSYAQFKRTDPASREAEQRVEAALTDLRLFTGAPQGTFYLGPSSTQALFYLTDVILSQAPPGSHVVTTNLDHPATYEATRFFAQKYGLSRKVVTFHPLQGRLEKEKIFQEIDDKTTLLALIHASNITGAVNELEDIIAGAREINPHLYVLVDGVQYAPHCPLDLERLNPDVYVFGGYKIFCKKGIAFAYLSPRAASLPHWQFQGLSAHEWGLGTLDEATLVGFSAVVDYLASLGASSSPGGRREEIRQGMERIRSHSLALLEMLLFGAEGIPGLASLEHVQLCGIDATCPGERTSLVSFLISGMDASTAAQEYWKEGISVSPRLDNVFSRHVLKGMGVKDVVRASLCHYNTGGEVLDFLQVTARLSR